MTGSPQFASLAIVDWQEYGAAIETLAVSEGECSLSGAWFITPKNFPSISDLLSNRLLIEIGHSRSMSFEFDISTVSVEISNFLESAKRECAVALEAYETFKSEEPKKRKNLVAPIFTGWPKSIELDQAAIHLETLGKSSQIQGTDPVMERVLTASRLLKWMIEGWLHDEQERLERPYINSFQSAPRVLPPSWLLVLPSRV